MFVTTQTVARPFTQTAAALIAARINGGLCLGIDETDVALALRAGSVAVLESERARELVPLMFREASPSLIVTAAIESGGSVASALRLYGAAVAAGYTAIQEWARVSTGIDDERQCGLTLNDTGVVS